MASMVAKACNSTSSQMPALAVQGKGSRNKRKFRADQPLADPNKVIPLPQNECTSLEISADKFEIISGHDHSNACDMCCANQDSTDAKKFDLGLTCTLGMSEVRPRRPREEIELSADDFRDADWSDLTQSQLEELILSNLDAIFQSAIKKIIASGYSKEVASRAILSSGIWYGCKDTVSNIVENTLTFLRSGQDIDPSGEHYFEDLQQLEKYILAELVCLLREVRPFFSTGDAMWCLLICDMNVSHACIMDNDPNGSFLDDADSNGNLPISAPPQLRTEPRKNFVNISVPHKPNASTAHAHKCPSKTANLDSNHGGNSLQSEAANVTSGPRTNRENSVAPDGVVQDEECNNSISNANEKPSGATGMSHTTVAEEKFVASRNFSGLTKREYILRQKSIFLEKHYSTHGSKSASRAGNSSFGGLVLDKKLKAVADSTGLNAKNSFKIDKLVGFDVLQNSANYYASTSTGFASVRTFGMHTSKGSSLPTVPVNASPSLPIADTELSLSFPAKSFVNPMPISYSIEAASCSDIGSSNDKHPGHWVPQDRNDEMIMNMVPRVRELQNQLQEWTEWANQKVMQAARRLSKDKSELKTLQQEKEEVERLKKEKQTLEDSTTKKLSEMENALFKASKQVERANAAVRRLDIENAVLRREMEAAKLRAAESAANCQEVSKREKRTLMKFQSWEKQKTVFQGDLAAERHKLMHLHQKLQHAKDAQDQAKVRWSQEEKASDELRTLASSFRKEREQIEASAISEEDMIKSTLENSLLKYKEDIERLEKEISHLRSKTDSSKIAALRRGLDGSYAIKVTNLKNTSSLRDSAMSYFSRAVTSTDISDFTANRGVKRERECVMCLSEEISVVFLPCAHQIVCTTCNELHEKQGMKDCPSCRSTILRRVCVHYPGS